MRDKFSRRGWQAVVGMAIFAIVAVAGRAQDEGEFPGGSAGQGVRMGNFILYPTLELIYQHETNLFLEPEEADPIDSSSYVVRPKVMLEMPFLRTYFRAGYSAEYRTYDAKEYDQPERWTHVVVMDARVRATRGVTASVGLRHVRSLLYTEEFDPNREVQFGTLPFVSTHAKADIGYRLNPRASGSVFGTFRTVRFDDDAAMTATRNFFDYSRHSAGLRGELRLTPLTALFFEGERATISRDRAYQDPANFMDDMKATETAFRGGVSGGLTPTLSGEVFFGYKKSEYDNALDETLTRGKYSGLIYGLSVKNRFSPHTTISGSVWREDNQSASLGSNYYVTTGGAATITHNFSRTVFTSLGLAFQQNSYAGESVVFGVVRDDDLYSVRAGLGFYFNERASVRLNYQYRTRDSNIPILDYKSSLYAVQAQVGW